MTIFDGFNDRMNEVTMNMIDIELSSTLFEMVPIED